MCLKGGTCVVERAEVLLVSLGSSFSLTMTGFGAGCLHPLSFLGRILPIQLCLLQAVRTPGQRSARLDLPGSGLQRLAGLWGILQPLPWAVPRWLWADRGSSTSCSGGRQPLPPLLLHRLLPTSSGKAGAGPLSSTRAPHNSRIGHERCWTWSGSPRAPLPSVPATPRCLPSPRPRHLPSSHHAPTSSKPFVHPMPCFRQTWSGVSPPAGSTSAGCAGMLVLGKIRLFPSLRSPRSYQQAAPGLPRARCRGRARLQPGQTGA